MTELKATTEHPGSSGIPKGFMTFGIHAATRPDPDKTRAFDNMFDTDSKGRCVLRMEAKTLGAHLKRCMGYWVEHHGHVSEITPDRIHEILLQGGGNFCYEAVPGDPRAEIRLEPN